LESGEEVWGDGCNHAQSCRRLDRATTSAHDPTKPFAPANTATEMRNLLPLI